MDRQEASQVVCVFCTLVTLLHDPAVFQLPQQLLSLVLSFDIISCFSLTQSYIPFPLLSSSKLVSLGLFDLVSTWEAEVLLPQQVPQLSQPWRVSVWRITHKATSPRVQSCGSLCADPWQNVGRWLLTGLPFLQLGGDERAASRPEA